MDVLDKLNKLDGIDVYSNCDICKDVTLHNAYLQINDYSEICWIVCSECRYKNWLHKDEVQRKCHFKKDMEELDAMLDM